MGDKKKVKFKVKKRKVKVKRIIAFILFIVLLTLLFLLISKIPIKNIYIVGNNIVSDKEIIEAAGIGDYPPLLSVKKKKAIDKIQSDVLIKQAKIKKNIMGKIYIYITERKILCTYNNELLLEDGIMVENTYNISNYPILISDISDVFDKFVKKFALVNDDVLLKISEIEYAPNNVDNERFILKMNDGNIVYVTLNKINKINKYNSIYSELSGKKGIIYLDSGDYVELKEE